ncbi:MAG: hypothetical protein ACJAT2_003803 [Bacteriovoracaceae bacterium]|jgi:hypothetical protein
MKVLLTFLVYLISIPSLQAYEMKHIDCRVRFNKSDDFLNRQAHEILADKGYKVQSFVNGNKMNVGDLYFKLDYKRDPSKMWKDCVVKVALKKAINQKEYSKDKTLYQKSVRRALPRHTFGGNERCKRGLKDAFVHIPKCVGMSVDEKVQGN